MTQTRKYEVVWIMSQMDADMQNYMIDILRNLKFVQDTLNKKRDIAKGESSWEKSKMQR